MAGKKTEVVVDQVHAEIERVNFNQKGKRLSKPKKQWFDLRAWNQFCENGPENGWHVIKIITAPNGITKYENPE